MLRATDQKIGKVDPSKPDTIPKFVDELPIPITAKPKTFRKNEPYYEIDMRQAMHQFHKFFPPTKIWGYNGVYPGPTLDMQKDQTIHVKWINNLPKQNLLPIDRTLHGSADSPDSRTVVHVHGAHVASDSDGYPESWFTKNFAQTGPTFTRKVYEYTNHQMGATLWYHDHAMGITRLNVYTGLAGFYLIRDPIEKKLKLPSGKYEIPLMIQDKSFQADGSLFYPENTAPPNEEVNPSVVPAFNGNTILVNGKIWPHLKVEPRKYRFRILNASNTNAYTLKLGNNQSFYLIGTDGGLVPEPVELESLPLEPAERADIIIDFSKWNGKQFVLQNTNEEGNLGVIMQFKVMLPLSQRDTSQIPELLIPSQPLDEHMAEKTRLLTLGAITDEYDRPMLLLDNRMWHDPVTEKPMLNSIEIWKFINLTPFPHPIHIHLIEFKILHRRPFDLDIFLETGAIEYTGPAIEPEKHERGWKDTVKVDTGTVTSVIMQFTNHVGDYVWHCHILEHEDYDMMRPFQVVKDPE
ncbi:multicopper oxidase family protein [Lederbergia lenta]|uniref:Spore copper-dependent laccase n=1 Tax=Lederbergia lenta TaxID=1467 RepID=A0A2X4VLW2_LEDLE|nr:multicopper oxidase [Lederbergia lenta]SQI53127.1 spore copper-dependent laccase [Lederbergia lenta]